MLHCAGHHGKVTSPTPSTKHQASLSLFPPPHTPQIKLQEIWRISWVSVRTVNCYSSSKFNKLGVNRCSCHVRKAGPHMEAPAWVICSVFFTLNVESSIGDPDVLPQLGEAEIGAPQVQRLLGLLWVQDSLVKSCLNIKISWGSEDGGAAEM